MTFTLSAYCCISFQPSLDIFNMLRVLVDSMDCDSQCSSEQLNRMGRYLNGAEGNVGLSSETN